MRRNVGVCVAFGCVEKNINKIYGQVTSIIISHVVDKNKQNIFKQDFGNLGVKTNILSRRAVNIILGEN